MFSSIFSSKPRKPTIIGLTGRAGAGKDTVAGFLAAYGYKRFAFADPLKAALKVMGIHEPANREEKEELIPGRTYSYRQAAQTLGTEWARNLDKDFWVKVADQEAKNAPFAAFSDVRFENEVDWIRSEGGVIWHLKRDIAGLQGETALHASERPLEIMPEDQLLYNNGDLEFLGKCVKDVMGKYR